MNQIIMILLISLLVLVHEIGHFIAARLCNVRVTRFGIGMPIGPSWKLFKWNKTTVYLHAFLFGGYVSFPDDEMSLSDNKNEKKEDINEDEILPLDSPELYENKTIGQKLFIVSAGVIMNLVFALILVMFCATFYHKLPTSNQNVFVNNFSETITSNIQEKGVLKGDKFEKANGLKINSLYQLTFFAKNSKMHDDYAQEDLIEKNLLELKKLNPNLKIENDIILKNQTVILPKIKPEKALEVNENILKGLEKYKKTGIKLTDSQLKLRDELYQKKSYKISNELSLKDLSVALSDTYKPIKLSLSRNGNEITIENVIVQKEGLLGVILKIEDIYTQTKTPTEIITKSFDYIYTTTKTMLFSLWQLFSGKVSMSDMHGVIAVVKVGGDVIASKGMLNGILLTAMISVNLAIMNFLPIPALDGGHVMFLAIEKITGRKPTKEMAEKINNFFFMLLIILMVAICYNDIFALITKKF